MKAKWFSMTIVIAMLFIAVVPMAGAAPGDHDDLGPQIYADGDDNYAHPLGDAQKTAKAKAVEAKLYGKANGKTIKIAPGKYVELELEKTDRVFVILAEFGDLIHPAVGGTPGPLHNEIAQPGPNDNTTIWQADYNPSHYEDMYFNQMVDYYAVQSSGRYTIEGDVVVEWVKVPYNEARYGSNAFGDSIVWALLSDAIQIWTADQIANGMTAADIQAYLDTFDVWDRYDYDFDGDFDESDGYIDHFQIVHAGVGEETGGGAQGSDAIWSHRWYAYYTGIGVNGPAFNPAGGTTFGSGVDMWVGDYTIQPENGGLGVFAHEYAHDLGLPDQYNTAGGGDNSTGFWTIMSSGSYLGDGKNDIGSRPGDFNAWEKFQLGWLNYDVAFAGDTSQHKLGPAEFNSNDAQGLFVVLPDKEVTEVIASPYNGSYFYYSGSGNDLANSMTRSFTLPAAPVTLTAAVNYEIETDWDYAYLLVDGVPVDTSESTTDDPNGQNFGYGITGSSGGWTILTADLSAYAGQTVDITFYYWTDSFVVEPGFMVDDIQITGQALDDAESDFGWDFDGFKVTTGSETGYYFNAYVAEYRQYRGYDVGLKTGPYNFGFLNDPNLGDYVEHFPYQEGLLISYWDTSYSDNNTATHPGGGLVLPVDAHPTALMQPNGVTPWRARVQAFDSTFTKFKTDKVTLHINGVASVFPSLQGVTVFNDMNSYWDPAAPLASVIVPNTGTTITIKKQTSYYMDVIVSTAP